MGSAHKFWDFMAKRYAKSPVSDEVAYQAKLEKTREYLMPESDVLEFGCGTGSTAIVLAPLVARYLATDFSANMLEIARGKAEGIENLSFQQAELEDVPLHGGYDAVLGHSILHLLPDKEATLAEVFARVKPGGVFISSTVCIGKNKVLEGLLWVGHKIRLLPRVSFFSAEALENSIKAAGFKIEHSWRANPKAALFLVARKPS